MRFSREFNSGLAHDLKLDPLASEFEKQSYARSISVDISERPCRSREKRTDTAGFEEAVSEFSVASDVGTEKVDVWRYSSRVRTIAVPPPK